MIYGNVRIIIAMVNFVVFLYVSWEGKHFYGHAIHTGTCSFN